MAEWSVPRLGKAAYDPFERRTWKLAHDAELELGGSSIIMGILNVTPDSFSDGGKFIDFDRAVVHAVAMKKEGAAIVDVGGESTKPGAEPVSGKEEQARVLPIIEALSDVPGLLISVDTYRSETAELAVKAGAHVINDVWGCQKDPALAKVAASTGAGLCAMHTGRERNKLDDVIADQNYFLTETIKLARRAGVDDQNLILDPGFGFAKSPEENIELLSRLEELHDFGFPLLVGASRKRFIGHYSGREANERDIATAATSVVARMKGAAIFRVHDITSNKDALAMADAVVSVMGNGD